MPNRSAIRLPPSTRSNHSTIATSGIEEIQVAWDDRREPPQPRRLWAEAGVDIVFSAPRGNTPGQEGPFAAEVFGAKTRPRWVHNPQPMWKLRVRVRAGMAPALFGVSASELTDGCADLGEFWGDGATRLVEALNLASGPAERRANVAATITRRFESADPRRMARARSAAACLTLIEASGGRATVRSLCAEMGIGERSLERLCRETLGLSPKAVAQLTRFHCALETLKRGTSGAETALQTGFADQSHLVRAFTRFAGAPPSRVLA